MVDPDEFDIVGSGERRHDGKTYRVIYGKPKGGDGSVDQAYRYAVQSWSEDEVRTHCRDHGGTFEPASRETSASAKQERLVEYLHGKGFRRAEDVVAALVVLLGEDLLTLIPESRSASTSDSCVELRFLAAVHSIETGEEQNLATFYIMNTSPNRIRWVVTDKALEDALPTLMNKPIGCGPDYRIDDHYPAPMKVGRFIKVEKPDGYALGKAEITDGYVWEKLKAGEWGPISVVISSYREMCTVCGEDISNDPWGHEHIKSGEGLIQIESFKFDRVDFIDVPAYPQAGLLAFGQTVGAEAPGVLFMASVVPFEETLKAPEDRDWDGDAAEARVRRWAGGPDKEAVDWSKYRRAFAWYDSGDPENFGSYKLPHHDVIDGRLSVVWQGVASAMQVLLGARGGVDIPESDRRGTYSHLARHYRQFEHEPPDYHESQSNMDGAQGPRASSSKPDEKGRNTKMSEELTELRQELETLKTENEELAAKIAELQSKLETLMTENEELKADLQRRKDARHQELVDRTVETRVKAGLAKDRKAETERLKKLDDLTLVILADDAEKVAEKLAKAPAAGPKAKYTPDAKSGFDVAVEDMREHLFGHRKEAGS